MAGWLLLPTQPGGQGRPPCGIPHVGFLKAPCWPSLQFAHPRDAVFSRCPCDPYLCLWALRVHPQPPPAKPLSHPSGLSHGTHRPSPTRHLWVLVPLTLGQQPAYTPLQVLELEPGPIHMPHVSFLWLREAQSSGLSQVKLCRKAWETPWQAQ